MCAPANKATSTVNGYLMTFGGPVAQSLLGSRSRVPRRGARANWYGGERRDAKCREFGEFTMHLLDLPSEVHLSSPQSKSPQRRCRGSASTHPYLRYGAKCLNTGIPTDARRSAAAARYRGRSPTRPPARPSSRNSEGRERVLRYRAPSSRRCHRHPRRRRRSRACCACCVISRCRVIVQCPSCYIETRRRACDDRVAVALESHRLNNKLVMPRRARARAGWGERVGAGWVNASAVRGQACDCRRDRCLGAGASHAPFGVDTRADDDDDARAIVTEAGGTTPDDSDAHGGDERALIAVWAGGLEVGSGGRTPSLGSSSLASARAASLWGRSRKDTATLRARGSATTAAARGA